MARGVKTGGRKPGSRNKRTLEMQKAAEDAAARIAASLGDDVFDGDAHALLMCVYKDGQRPIDIRIEAAKAAVKYEKPALQAVTLEGDVTQRFVSQKPMSPEDWAAKHASED